MAEDFTMPEGYFDAVEDVGDDVDHGPYRSYTFPCGSIMYTYYDKPGLVSFHVCADEMGEVKTYRVSRSYMVTRCADVEATSEAEAERIAREDVDLHWKEYDGEYIAECDYNVEEA